ncbi:MAG: hypothetical protein IT322_06410 [Anaerolineae bacterium]|nr:hypothetical protein [Anaerolineae bacterium]
MRNTNTASRFMAAFLLEVRLIVWHWSYALLLLIWIGLVVATTQPSMASARVILEMSTGRNAIGLLSLIALFIGSLSATRAARNRFDQLEEAYPSSVEILIGRWLAVVVVLLPFLLPPLVITFGSGSFNAWWALIPTYLFEGTITVAFTAAFAYALMGWLGLHRWIYPLLVLLWLAVTMGTTLLAVNTPSLSSLTLLNFARLGALPQTQLWGRVTLGSLPQLFNGFYIAFSAGLLALLAWKYIGRRFNRRSVLASMAMLVSIVLLVMFGAQYVAVNALAESPMSGSVPDSYVVMEPLREALPLQVTDYDIQIDFGSAESPRYTTTITLANVSAAPLAILDLTLNSSLRVTEATLPYERDGHSLRLKPPQPLQPREQLTVTLHYEGAIWQMLVYRGAVQAANFTRTDGIRLSYSAAWYPVAGTRPVRISPITEPTVTSSFRVRVEGVNGLNFATNLQRVDSQTWQAKSAYFTHLIGVRDLAEVKVGQFTLIGLPDDVDRARPAVEQYYIPALEVFSRYFDQLAPEFQLFIGDTTDGLPWFGPTLRADNIITMIEYPLSIQSLERTDNLDNQLDLLMTAAYFDNDFMMQLITGDLARFLWAHHKANGDSTRIAAILNPGYYGVATAINELYAREGEAGIHRLIAEIQANKANLKGMPSNQLVAWIKEVSGAH